MSTRRSGSLSRAGYLLKSGVGEEILEAAQSVLTGGRLYVSPGLSINT